MSATRVAQAGIRFAGHRFPPIDGPFSILAVFPFPHRPILPRKPAGRSATFLTLEKKAGIFVSVF
jgi:hypothetical protein